MIWPDFESDMVLWSAESNTTINSADKYLENAFTYHYVKYRNFT